MSAAARAALDLQAPYMNATGRGLIAIKGKGDMQTFWLDKPSEGTPYPELVATGRGHAQTAAYEDLRRSLALDPADRRAERRVTSSSSCSSIGTS